MAEYNYEIELNILNSLIGSKNIEEEFAQEQKLNQKINKK